MNPYMVMNIYYSIFQSSQKYDIALWSGDEESNNIFKLKKKS
jgi:hypothetical protein